jgi:hypothetical protein
MNRRIAAAFFMAYLGPSVASAHAGPCTDEIAHFELAVRQSAGKPDAGPIAPQSIGAQIDRQPTPASIKRAEKRAQAIFAATLARAKRLDRRGNRAGCTRALSAAKNMYDLQ